MAEIQPGGLIYQHHYDRDFEAQTEANLMQLIMWLQEWNTRNTYVMRGVKYVKPIQDSQAIAEIRKVFSEVKFLLIAYKEDVTSETLKPYIEFLGQQKTLDAPTTLTNLERLSEIVAKELKIKHNFKDRTESDQPWDKEFKKKLEFPNLEPEEQAYYNGIEKDWEKMCWLLTYYVVKLKGDAHVLLSGPNLSGKSNTAIRLLEKCNWYLVNYWKVDKYNEYYIEKHPEAKDVKQERFHIKKDIYITPDASELKARFESEQYQCLDINEGMEAATNLQSMNKDIVALGVKRFTSRSYHNIVIWEYQVQQRPTMMMLEGMNFWIQKMRKRHFILSIASTLVRKKDPYYMEELNKCRTDKEIGRWMTRLNPNFIHTFRAPKLGPKQEHIFQMHYWEQKDKQTQSDTIKQKMSTKYNLMVEDVWNRINIKHTMGIIEIDGFLEEMGFNQRDRTAFIRDYGKYNRVKMYENWSATKGTEEMKMVNK